MDADFGEEIKDMRPRWPSYMDREEALDILRDAIMLIDGNFGGEYDPTPEQVSERLTRLEDKIKEGRVE